LLKLGHLKLGAAIRSKNADAKADAEAFIARYLKEFTDTVSDAAHATVKRMPCRLDEFPDAADFAWLKEFQQTTSERLCKELASMPSQSLWRELAELTMYRILVFNARRGKEVTDLKLSEYKNRTNFVLVDILDSIVASDQELVRRYQILIILY
jgi:hypothetical protein